MSPRDPPHTTVTCGFAGAGASESYPSRPVREILNPYKPGDSMPIRPENKHRYPPDWREISLRIRTVRAAGHCECLGECGRGTHEGRCPNRNGQPAYGTGSKVVLTVAHLDHTPEHVDESNLRAMCNGCHLHYDRDHHRETAAATRRAAREAAGQTALDLES